jgi:hypothetical protein
MLLYLMCAFSINHVFEKLLKITFFKLLLIRSQHLGEIFWGLVVQAQVIGDHSSGRLHLKDNMKFVALISVFFLVLVFLAVINITCQ